VYVVYTRMYVMYMYIYVYNIMINPLEMFAV